MSKIKKNSLVGIIYKDLYTYGKVQLFLLFLVLISAILVVIITYQTRCMIIYREELLLQKRAIDAEWNSLVLQEKMLSHHNRIEKIAIDVLHMQYVEIKKGDVLIE